MVSNILALYVMPGDMPDVCRHYYCSAKGKEEHTEAYVVLMADFRDWLDVEKTMPEEGVALYDKPP